MLYISRVGADGKFMVLDTDDNIETPVTYDQLTKIVSINRLEVAGVECDEEGFIGRVVPYQDMRYYSTLQAKTKTMLGVDIHTYKDEITSIVVNDKVVNNLQHPVKIRLSDFGKRICEFAIFMYSAHPGMRFVTLILDDKVEIIGRSSTCVGSIGFRWDIREVKNQETVEYIYRGLTESSLIDVQNWPRFLIDSSERYTLWFCAARLGSTEAACKETVKKAFALMPDKKALSAAVGEIYKEEFAELASRSFDFGRVSIGQIEVLYNLVRGLGNKPFPHSDYEFLRGYFIPAFSHTRRLTMAGFAKFQRFENYVRFFEAPDDIQDLYIQFCEHVREAVFNWIELTSYR